jgi:hypothetical protein
MFACFLVFPGRKGEKAQIMKRHCSTLHLATQLHSTIEQLLFIDRGGVVHESQNETMDQSALAPKPTFSFA